MSMSMPLTAKDILNKASSYCVKVGTESVLDMAGNAHQAWLDAMAEDIAAQKDKEKNIVIVSSGAIGLGRKIAGIDPQIPNSELPLEVKQQLSTIGQPALMQSYIDAFQKVGLIARQILLTRDVIEHPEQLRNLVNTCRPSNDKRFRHIHDRSVIIINEDDALKVDEIKFGDNDMLGAITAEILNMEALVIGSKLDGLYTDDPNIDPSAKFIPYVPDVRQAFVYARDNTSTISTGGMVSRLKAAQYANERSINVILAKAQNIMHWLENLHNGHENTRSTICAAHAP